MSFTSALADQAARGARGSGQRARTSASTERWSLRVACTMRRSGDETRRALLHCENSLDARALGIAPQRYVPRIQAFYLKPTGVRIGDRIYLVISEDLDDPVDPPSEDRMGQVMNLVEIPLSSVIDLDPYLS